MPLLRQHIPVFLAFGYALHTSNTTRPPTLKRDALKIPKCNLKSLGQHSFSFIAPSVWNPLPASLRNLPTLSEFEIRIHLTYVALHGSDMVHGCLVYTDRAQMAAVSCGTSHASKYTTSVDIEKHAIKS